MATTKNDLQRLTDLVGKNFAELEKLERERTEALPAYAELQVRCEDIASRLMAHAKTALNTSNPDENLYQPWEGRRTELEQQLEQSVTERDEVLRGLNLELHQTLARIIAQNGGLTGAVQGWLLRILTSIENSQTEAMAGGIIHPRLREGWAWQVVESGQAGEVVSELKRMRADLDKMSQNLLHEAIEAVTRSIEFVEQIPGFDGPLCRLDTLVARALAPEAEAVSAS